jgi:hypothetical protein
MKEDINKLKEIIVDQTIELHSLREKHKKLLECIDVLANATEDIPTTIREEMRAIVSLMK